MKVSARRPFGARAAGVLAGLAAVGTGWAAAAAEAAEGAAGGALRAAAAGSSAWAATAPYYAAALVMGIACVAAAYAVGKVGAAALGAAAEKPELLVKSIVLVGLGEGIAVFGLIISMLLVAKAG